MPRISKLQRLADKHNAEIYAREASFSHYLRILDKLETAYPRLNKAKLLLYMLYLEDLWQDDIREIDRAGRLYCFNASEILSLMTLEKINPAF